MGCDIHIYLETRSLLGGKWHGHQMIYNGRHYGLFGWLADVRNYSAVPKTPVTVPGLPKDVSENVQRECEEWGGDVHHHHWANLPDLLSIDYDQEILDCRVTRQVGHGNWDGGCTTNDPNGAKRESLRDFLGKEWFDLLDRCRMGSEQQECRLIMWFDN